MKRMSALLCVVAMLSVMVCSALAAETKQQEKIDLGDGFYLVETIVQSPLGRAGDTASGTKRGDVYSGSTKIGTASLTAIFDLSGSSAKATDASIDGTGQNGGTYLRGTTRLSGNKAYGTAYFSYNGVQKTVNLTLSCSASGVLS